MISNSCGKKIFYYYINVTDIVISLFLMKVALIRFYLVSIYCFFVL